MTDLDNMDELEADYGPPAAYAEHRVGERVTYRQRGRQLTGRVVYVVAPRVSAGIPLPTTYVIVRDEHEGMPDEVCAGALLHSAEPGEERPHDHT